MRQNYLVSSPGFWDDLDGGHGVGLDHDFRLLLGLRYYLHGGHGVGLDDDLGLFLGFWHYLDSGHRVRHDLEDFILGLGEYLGLGQGVSFDFGRDDVVGELVDEGGHVGEAGVAGVGGDGLGDRQGHGFEFGFDQGREGLDDDGLSVDGDGQGDEAWKISGLHSGSV